ncbi:Cobalamin (vitamin B12) biosynthesis CbiM family [Syntrophomonas zehnderi OL-4]|uniref:Cobalamin (Vitamin B12) biosynthesis CbiM family n=1 Tax=Syntrophomonas zehnderi OL-4 TaxID=690567 RepID=A0A0E3W2W9_9FIRM|nr:cobalt transporter CbiM [Syntrophomonas zehnderi]CFX27761.1 Cobalamin (vitamin B12) biosynthesis CbiM family [Syntrophomonas zehnderi OL-4]
MHIPDGYLSPQTAIPFVALMIPVWGIAVKKVQKTLKKKEVPVLAIGAAFSFTIMMFNLPIPGGSSAHAVGAVLLAILLGPWAACIGVSVALIIQALIFGDGGVLAIGANCFNMGFVMPMVGYYVYRLIKGQAESLSTRSLIAAFMAGYLGLNAAALITAVEFGSQYHLFQAANGMPLYFPVPLKVAVAAMMSEHLILAGPVEGLVTALGVWFVGKNYPAIMAERMEIGGRLDDWGVGKHV